MPALNELDYPRYVHKKGHAGDPDGDHCLVADATDAEAKIAEGWSIDPFGNCYDELPKDADPSPASEPAKPAKPAKK